MRSLLPGSMLDLLSMSLDRFPDFAVYIWNPRQTTINELASGRAQYAPLDVTAYTERIAYKQNVGYENGDDPQTTHAVFSFKRVTELGAFRRGWIDDGAIVRIYQGDTRIRRSDWVCIFTGTFRGKAGDNPGSPADQDEGFTATAHGREERFLNRKISTPAFPNGTDLGTIAAAIAHNSWGMGLGQDEIRFGAVGFQAKHVTNQVLDHPALQSLWECLFPVGKKPAFDSEGCLVAVDVSLNKPAARIYRDGSMIRKLVATPNEIEVNNQVVLTGLNAVMEKVIQEFQRLSTYTTTTGFFDSKLDVKLIYGKDGSQRAMDTYVREVDRIRWSDASWSEIDEFHGRLSVDTHELRNARAIIFASFLVTQLLVALLDYIAQQAAGVLGTFTALIRLIAQIASMVTLALLLWSMNFIGRGTYEIWGRPYEMVYKELMVEAQLPDLLPEELRPAEFRNDFLSSMDVLVAAARERLKRELVKNQTYTIEIMDDLTLEVDDVIEYKGDRYYITTIEKEISRGGSGRMTLTCWKIFDHATAQVYAAAGVAAA